MVEQTGNRICSGYTTSVYKVSLSIHSTTPYSEGNEITSVQHTSFQSTCLQGHSVLTVFCSDEERRESRFLVSPAGDDLETGDFKKHWEKWKRSRKILWLTQYRKAQAFVDWFVWLIITQGPEMGQFEKCVLRRLRVNMQVGLGTLCYHAK